MPQEKFQCKQRRTKSVLQTEAPSAVPHSGGGSAYMYEVTNTRQLSPAVGESAGCCISSGYREGPRGQVPLLGPQGSARFTWFCGHR